MIFLLARVVSQFLLLGRLCPSIVICFAIFVPTRGHFYTVVVWCMGALRTECSHGLLMVGAMGGAGVVYSGSLKVAPGCYCGGLLYLFRLAGVACGLGTEEGGGTAFTSTGVSASPDHFLFSTPVHAMQGLRRFHCSVSNGWWHKFIIFVGAMGRGDINID